MNVYGMAGYFIFNAACRMLGDVCCMSLQASPRLRGLDALGVDAHMIQTGLTLYARPAEEYFTLNTT